MAHLVAPIASVLPGGAVVGHVPLMMARVARFVLLCRSLVPFRMRWASLYVGRSLGRAFGGLEGMGSVGVLEMGGSVAREFGRCCHWPLLKFNWLY